MRGRRVRVLKMYSNTIHYVRVFRGNTFLLPVQSNVGTHTEHTQTLQLHSNVRFG